MNTSVTLSQLAEAKALAPAFLAELGLHNLERGGVGIPYYDASGKELLVKRRTAVRAGDGSFWPRGQPLLPYGLWKLAEARKSGFLVLVEGESDCWALWRHGVAALGLPGCEAARALQHEHLREVKLVYVHREPDHGGERFVAGLVRRLTELGYAGQVHELTLPAGVKDLADLHVQQPPAFLQVLMERIEAARPLPLATAGEPTDAWETPTPLDMVPAEPFPLAALPAPLRRMAEAVAAALPCAVDLPACHLLAAAATAIGTTRRLEIKSSWHEGARLWIAIVAPPGCKKSPAGRAILGPLYRAQQRLRAEVADDQQRYEDDLVRWKQRLPGDDIPRPVCPVKRQVFASDTTREAMTGLLEANPRGLLLYRDELSGWVRSLNQYKGGRGDDKQFYLSLWSGEPIVVNRRDFDKFVPNPFVCVAGNIPPDVLGELHDAAAGEDGFVQRLLFSWPEPTPAAWTEAEPPAEVVRDYDALFEALFALQPELAECGAQPQTLRLSADGRALFAMFVEQGAAALNDPEFPDSLRGAWSKLEGYCARLALVVHVCRQVAGETASSDVDYESVTAAVQLARYFQGHARRVFPRLGAQHERVTEDARVVLDWVRRHRVEVERPTDVKPAMAFTWRMVRHDLCGRFEARDLALEKALVLLEERGYLRTVLRERNGPIGRRPKPTYRVSPLVWARK